MSFERQDVQRRRRHCASLPASTRNASAARLTTHSCQPGSRVLFPKKILVKAVSACFVGIPYEAYVEDVIARQEAEAAAHARQTPACSGTEAGRFFLKANTNHGLVSGQRLKLQPAREIYLIEMGTVVKKMGRYRKSAGAMVA